MPLLLSTARSCLLALFALHLALAAYLKSVNRRARPDQYVFNDSVETSLASRTMLLSGLVIFAFVIYHLLHFTLGVTDSPGDRLPIITRRNPPFTCAGSGIRVKMTPSITPTKQPRAP